MKRKVYKFNSSGSFLIELLIYIALSSIFFILLFQLVIYVSQNYFRVSNFSSKLNAIDLTLDLLSNDLRKSSTHIKSWKILKNNELIWVDQNKQLNDIGWIFKNNKIYRIEGNYDSQNQTWHNKIESLVCSNVDEFEIKINHFKNNNQNNFQEIKLISIALTSKYSNKKIKIEKVISPRNGLISL